MRRSATMGLLFAIAGCSGPIAPGEDAAIDAGSDGGAIVDAATDSPGDDAALDATVLDGAPSDGASSDAAPPDAGPPDAGPLPPFFDEADPTFAIGGLATMNLDPGVMTLFSVVRQSDGRLVALGRTFESFFLARATADGDLDPTFGAGGIVRSGLGRATGMAQNTGGLALAPDDSIVAATYAEPIGGGATVAVAVRYDRDGRADPAFGVGGVVVRSTAGFRSLWTGVAVQTDGRILVAGNDFQGRLERLMPDGSSDASFGSSGLVRPMLGGAAGVSLQPDGRILLAGFHYGGGLATLAVARFTSDGTLDATFGGGTGYFVDVSAPGGASQAYDAHADGAGRILVAGSRGGSGGNDRFALGRLSPDGAPDATFAAAGWAMDDPAAMRSAAFGVGELSGGRTVGVGIGTFSGVEEELVGLATDGSLDPPFGTGGLVPTSTARDRFAMLVQPDDAIVTVGSSGFTRRTATGALDSTFGSGGSRAVPTASVDRALAIALAPDGSFVLGGAAGMYGIGALARFGPDGARDDAFGRSGVVHTTIVNVVTSVAIDAAGRILVGGLVSPLAGDGRVVVERHLATGAPDTAFGPGGISGAALGAGVSSAPATFVLASDGTIYAVGFGTGGSGPVMGAVALRDDGTLDGTWGAGGIATVPGVASGRAAAAITSDGSLLVAGPGVLARVAPDGTPDASFGASGIATLPPGQPVAMELQPDGAIVVALAAPGGSQLSIARFDAGGVLDATFGSGGVVTEALGTTTHDATFAAMGLAIAGGAIYAGASSGSDGLRERATLFRYTIAGVRDATFGVGGQLDVPMSRDQSSIHALEFDASGRVLVVGRAFTDAGSSDFAVARLR